MNKHLQEIAEQANIEFTYDPTETPMRAFVECWENELEKFAESIIRECRDIVAKTRDQAIENDWNVDEAMSTAMFEVEEHFGV